jgi:hypothetical protein
MMFDVTFLFLFEERVEVVVVSELEVVILGNSFKR